MAIENVNIIDKCRSKIVIIKQGDSGSEFIIYFGTKFKLSVDLQLLKVMTVLGFTSNHCHKLFVEL